MVDYSKASFCGLSFGTESIHCSVPGEGHAFPAVQGTFGTGRVDFFWFQSITVAPRPEDDCRLVPALSFFSPPPPPTMMILLTLQFPGTQTAYLTLSYHH